MVVESHGLAACSRAAFPSLARPAILVAAIALMLPLAAVAGGPPGPSTFSIVAVDPEAGEVGVAVASRFFSVGSVVPWARADAGAVATQANANTSWGVRGLELLAAGLSPDEALTVLRRTDSDPSARQAGIVAADGRSATWTGPGCKNWAGGRAGKNYAIQGNILAGPQVVEVMELKFKEWQGDLPERLFAALRGGDAAGGDSRGKESAALIVYRTHGGFNGFNDRAIDIRVDDSEDPFPELGRLLKIARMNDIWNRSWTLFTQKKYAEALPLQEKAAALSEFVPAQQPEVLYDLAVIRLAAGRKAGALEALAKALKGNPKLKAQAKDDSDLAALRGEGAFQDLVRAAPSGKPAGE